MGSPLSMRARKLRRLRWGVVTAATVVLASGCGGGGSSGGGASAGLQFRALWEQRAAEDGATATSATRRFSPRQSGFGRDLPAAVKMVRVAFSSEAGPSCCLAIDPRNLPVDPDTGTRRLLLDGLPSGPATFQIDGFPTTQVPPQSTNVGICATIPPGQGQPCSGSPFDTPSFASDPQSVTLVAGGETNAGDVECLNLGNPV